MSWAIPGGRRVNASPRYNARQPRPDRGLVRRRGIPLHNPGMPPSIHSDPYLTTDHLEARYRQARDPVEHNRWHALWLLARGMTATAAARVTGLRACVTAVTAQLRHSWRLTRTRASPAGSIGPIVTGVASISLISLRRRRKRRQRSDGRSARMGDGAIRRGW